MSSALEIQLIAILISVACALPGSFLVLRKCSMMVESIVPTVLLGIVVAFLITHDLHSPYLIIGAALVGVITTWLTELLAKSNLVSSDASTGIIFTLLFSIAIILLSRYAGKIHLCEDAVLMGELAFAPFDRLKMAGLDVGAKALYIASGLLVLNLAVIILFFKELKLSTFDAKLAAAMGLSPAILHYVLMTMVSVTAVGSFPSIGSILVVAFMIGPPSSAYLLSNHLSTMITLSALFATINSIVGYQLADRLDVSLSGSMAVATGISFALVLFFAPQRGILGRIRHAYKV